MITTPTFDIIIPTYNNLSELKDCLRGFGLQTFTSFRVLVCVDGSTDGTVEYLHGESFPFPLIVLEHPDKKNHGRNSTRNLTLGSIQAEYICFFDSDILPATTLLANHYQELTKHNCISIGDVRYTNTSDNLWASYTQTRGKNKYTHGSLIPYYYLATGNCAHKSELFIALGGQDGNITKYGGGDTEYALRLHKQFHLPVVFNARAFGNSEMNKSLQTALKQMEEFGCSNLPYIHTKHPDVNEIFGLEVLQGTSIRSRVIRALIINPIAQMFERTIESFPQAIAHRLLHYCVINRIKCGWNKRGE